MTAVPTVSSPTSGTRRSPRSTRATASRSPVGTSPDAAPTVARPCFRRSPSDPPRLLPGSPRHGYRHHRGRVPLHRQRHWTDGGGDPVKLYIWEGRGISSAYHDDGTLVVLAASPEHARQVVKNAERAYRAAIRRAGPTIKAIRAEMQALVDA